VASHRECGINGLDSSPMRTRTFGTTDLPCSEIAFGTWALGSDWWGNTDEPERLIGRALELGVTFFDTGDAYGQGVNEEIVGRALRGADRDSIQISTKFGYVLDSDRQQHSEGERPQDWSPAHARSALEGSLRRLGTDFVDLYQLHNPRMDAVRADGLFAELEALKVEGKLRHYGVALGPAIGWRDEGLEALATRRIAALQTVYNLLEQEPGSDFLAAGADAGAGIMARVPTSSGLLEDKYTLETTFSGNDHRRHRPREWLVDGLKKIDQLRFLVIEGERTMTQAALRFILAQPHIACVVPTVTSFEELEEFAGAADTPDLTPDELAHIGELYERDFGLAGAAA
jgi:aryl-alcohol dehydrogenase-like predicted oxidoreductase